jgi:uncharacterized RDD family membrane protein YckC
MSMSIESTGEDGHQTMLGQYAGFVTRMIGFITDRLVLAFILTIIGLGVNMVLDLFPISEWLGLGTLSSATVAAIAATLTISIDLIYHIGLWMLAGQTLGQSLMGVRVVRVNGDRITFWPAVGRWLGYIVSAILFLGFLWVLVDDRRQGFHDKIAGTVVIYSWPQGELRGTFVRDRARQIKERREQHLQQHQHNN